MSEQENQIDQPTTPVKPNKPEDHYDTFDTSIVYEYKDQPDIISGRCDNCGSAHFHSKVGNGMYLRKCSNCGMSKNI